MIKALKYSEVLLDDLAMKKSGYGLISAAEFLLAERNDF